MYYIIYNPRLLYTGGREIDHNEIIWLHPLVWNVKLKY